MIKLSQIAAAAALALSFGGAQAAYVIDSFSTPQAAEIRDNVTDTTAATAVQVLGSDILGGARDVFILKEGDKDFDPRQGVSSDVFAVNGNGRWIYNEESGQKGLGVARWDGLTTGGDINQGGLMNMDLTAFGSAFKVDILDADATVPLTIRAWTLLADSSYLLSSLRIDAASVGSYVFNFADFTSISGAKADFSNVGALELQINGFGVNDLDTQIDMISVVPEPGTLALAGIALLGLGAIRRRKS